eukprot:CAMPEP_0119538980 /NCGR_PEP_ID=MMETSP1344-20130328/51268_1 /TAXON_ID=236787 /ORGANISM="Florenciella parvula, Strain CCMP2471" /LENGTH=72 /DNA_ID=CAMNT_0007582105 /DNA_START=55 /DNA_END=270 /DNA_ORIENTATION=-
MDVTESTRRPEAERRGGSGAQRADAAGGACRERARDGGGIVRQRAHFERVPHVALGLLVLGVELGVGASHEG